INSMTGVFGYAKQKMINYKIAFTIGISALPGAIAGVWLLEMFSSQYFYVIFATILVALGLFLFQKNSPWRKEMKTNDNAVRTAFSEGWFIPLGFMMGVLSSYLGIGGGWLLVPILIYLFKIPTHQAAATSLLSLSLYSFVGVVSQFFYQNIDWMTILFGGAGVILGANVGVMVARKIPSKMVLQMLSVLLVIIGMRM